MIKNIIIGGLALIAIVLAVFLQSPTETNLGNKTASFWDTSEGYKVDGTVVIDGTGNVDAPITSTTGTFSSTLDVTGQFKSRVGATTLAASTTLTSANSGTTYYMGTTNLQVTLPEPAAGVWYRFTVNGNFATTNMLVQGPAADAADDVIYGALEVAGAVVACSAEDTVSFVNTA